MVHCGFSFAVPSLVLEPIFSFFFDHFRWVYSLSGPAQLRISCKSARELLCFFSHACSRSYILEHRNLPHSSSLRCVFLTMRRPLGALHRLRERHQDRFWVVVHATLRVFWIRPTERVFSWADHDFFILKMFFPLGRHCQIELSIEWRVTVVVSYWIRFLRLVVNGAKTCFALSFYQIFFEKIHRQPELSKHLCLELFSPPHMALPILMEASASPKTQFFPPAFFRSTSNCRAFIFVGHRVTRTQFFHSLVRVLCNVSKSKEQFELGNIP